MILAAAAILIVKMMKSEAMVDKILYKDSSTISLSNEVQHYILKLWIYAEYTRYTILVDGICYIFLRLVFSIEELFTKGLIFLPNLGCFNV